MTNYNNKNKTNVSDSIDADLQHIGKQPMLTLEQESELAARIQTGDKTALYQIMKGNLRFVVSVLLPYQGKDKSLTELIRAGNKGLRKAAERFVPAKTTSSLRTPYGISDRALSSF